ncbi:unnamed protein product [Ilex paraguariensis]|uniref:Mei2-like C-terminal RNA recognition motif domain-containing protein n=1 Tax=Ilex paraguariensis TaxID=185542 RepID=A0ABC8TVY4_9AQUA
MCRESTAMASPSIPKPLDPNARPWYPARAEKFHPLPLQNFDSPPPSTPPLSLLPPPPPPPQFSNPVQTKEPSLLSPSILYQQALVSHILHPPIQPAVGFPLPLPVVFYGSSPQTFPGLDFYPEVSYNIHNIQLPQQFCRSHAQKTHRYPDGVDRGVEVNGSSGEKVMETAKAGEKIEGLRSCFGREKRDVKFVPLRSRVIRGHSMEFGEKIRRLEWQPRKTKFDQGGVGGTVPSFPPSPTPSPADDSNCENTTVMIKNIPNQFRKDNNLGYAFVNFTSFHGARKFREILHNHKWGAVRSSKGVYESKKICEIRWARIQGKDELVRRFQNSSFACSTREYLPVVLSPPRNGSSPNTLPITVDAPIWGELETWVLLGIWFVVV